MEQSRQRDGDNELPAPKRAPLIVTYFRQMANLFSFVLFICGILSIVAFILNTRYWISLYTGLIFWFVAFFNAALEFWQTYSSAKVLEGFLSLVPANVLVIRGGQTREIQAKELVVGDLVILRIGNKVPADGRLIYADNVRVDNSSLTGESEPQERYVDVQTCQLLEAKNMVFSGTIIVSGNAIALIVRTGPKTVIGRLAAFAVTAPKRTSALEYEMTIIIRRLVVTAFFFGNLALVLGLSLEMAVSDALTSAIGIFVSFLPQGLPATMTILLTTAAKRMAARQVLVKELRSVETLGSMTLLATDKTGTLTQNKMAVVGAWIYGTIYNNVEEIDAVIGKIGEFAKSITLCTSCKLEDSTRGQPIEERNIIGDATEVGILKYFGKFEDLDSLFEKYKRVFEMPFTSLTKIHMTIYQMDNGNNHHTILLKGAPERVLSRCLTFRKENETITIDDSLKEEFQLKYNYFGGLGLRVLAIARKELDPKEYPLGFKFEKDPENFPTEGMEFLGFICLRDPPKPGVSWAINRLRDANIRVVMVTGDHSFTAAAIGKQVGIITEVRYYERPPTQSDVDAHPDIKAAVIAGENIESMTRSDWKRLADMDEIIFARTAPRQKLEIVKQFQAAGHIVGVSGDGVNDSPALRQANLGISMNKTASDVSKDAAHLILLDDNFVSIVAGVFEGRLIFENVKKSIRYTLTHITAEISSLLIYSLLLIPPPISPILLLFIDVFAELGPAVSFAREPPEYDLMALPPRQKVKEMISNERKIGQALTQMKIVPEFSKKALIKCLNLFYLRSSGENLVDNDLVLWSFLQGGVIIAMGSWGAYVLALVANRVNLAGIYRSDLIYWSYTSPDLTLTDGSIANASQQLDILGSVQAAVYLAIVIVQWFNVFMQKHRYRLPYGRDMLINWSTYVGIACAMMVASIVCFIPGLNYIFDTQIPPGLSVASPFAAATLLIVYEFIRRTLRVDLGWFGGIPNKQVMRPPDVSAEKYKKPPVRHISRELSIIDRPTN